MSFLMRFEKSGPTQKVTVKTRALRQKTGKVVVQPAHTETRKKAEPKAAPAPRQPRKCRAKKTPEEVAAAREKFLNQTREEYARWLEQSFLAKPDLDPKTRSLVEEAHANALNPRKRVSADNYWAYDTFVTKERERQQQRAADSKRIEDAKQGKFEFEHGTAYYGPGPKDVFAEARPAIVMAQFKGMAHPVYIVGQEVGLKTAGRVVRDAAANGYAIPSVAYHYKTEMRIIKDKASAVKLFQAMALAQQRQNAVPDDLERDAGLTEEMLRIYRVGKSTSSGGKQKVTVKTRALRQKTGKVVVQPAHTETRKKAAPKADPVKVRNTAGLTAEQMAYIHSLIASGQLEVGKSGSSYVVRSKPEGKTRWSRVGEFQSQGDALQAIASKVLVTMVTPPPEAGKAEAKPPAAPERPAEWELQGYKLKVVGNKVHVITPYDEKIISAAKSRGGRWDRDRKAWVIPLEKYESMRAMIEKHLGAKAEHDKAAKERAKQEAGERRAAEQAAREAHDKANRDTPAEEWARGPFRITVYPTTVSLRSPKNYDMIAEIKKIPGASWSNNVWTVDRSHYARLREIAERYSADFVVPANAQPWQSGSYKLSIYKSRVGLLSPYNTELIARVKRIPGAEWFPQEKEWRVPGAQYDALRAVAEEFASKDSAAKQEQAAKTTDGKKRQAEVEAAQGIVKFGHMGPETARRSDFSQVGDVVKHDGVWVVITRAKYQLGLGEDFSFASFEARPATDEEARPYVEAEERSHQRQLREAKRTELAARITAEGEQPSELSVPDGERYSDRQNIHGGGDWFVVGPKYIWYVRNNGMDGDNWARNNVRTGGAGAIGWRVPRSDELVAEIQAITSVTQEQKSLTRAGQDLKRMANREPINTDDEPLRKGLWFRFTRSMVAAHTRVVDGKVQHVKTYHDRRSKAVAKVTTARGNVQYQYDAETLAAAKAEKFRRVAHLAKRLPEILEGMKADLAQGDTPQSKVAAAVVALIDRCCFRIGTDEYAEKHGTYGVTTLRPEHVTVDGATIRFQFTGKKQVPWDTATTDPDLADFIAHLARDAPADRLFWYHRDGRQYPIRANHVNDWLREYGVSAKDFRTYHATRLCFEELKRLSSRKPLTKKEIKQRVKQAVAATAERLGHTPAVCRQSYILPAVIDDFEANGGRLSIDPWKTARNMGKSFLLAFGGSAQ